MTSAKQIGPFHRSDSTELEEFLQQMDPYITSQVERLVYASSHSERTPALLSEIDDITQMVRIKLWRALQEKQIQYPQAYIRRMIHNELNDFWRRRPSPLPPSSDEDGEIKSGNALVTLSEGMNDPA